MQRGESGEDLCAQASLAYLQEQTNPTQALDLYQEGKGNKIYFPSSCEKTFV